MRVPRTLPPATVIATAPAATAIATATATAPATAIATEAATTDTPPTDQNTPGQDISAQAKQEMDQQESTEALGAHINTAMALTDQPS